MKNINFKNCAKEIARSIVGFATDPEAIILTFGGLFGLAASSLCAICYFSPGEDELGRIVLKFGGVGMLLPTVPCFYLAYSARRDNGPR